MPFDINSVRGAQGVSVGVKALSLPNPGIFGFAVGIRKTVDAPGVFGFAVTLPANALLILRPTNFATITASLTISISWAGHSAESYPYGPDFVTRRDFPLNTLITFQTSGPGYVTNSSTATFTSTVQTAVDIPVSVTNTANAYRRRMAV